ncbi:hypothetical protein BH09ACT12_BH09ACT12_33660 [soil metagenome]
MREARRRAGLTQQQLADRADTTQSAIARLESGATAPSYDAVLRLVRLCGLDLEAALVERDDSDWAQTERLLQLSPAERASHADRVRAVMYEARRAGERHRARA